MEMNAENQGEVAEFSLDIFNVSQESDEIEIKLDEDFNADVDSLGRRC
jgi:hypothetical protein